MWIGVIIYFIIGFWVVKPSDLNRHTFSRYGVDYSDGFFMCAIPYPIFILMMALWPLIALLKFLGR
jgi:hypothetical protein